MYCKYLENFKLNRGNNTNAIEFLDLRNLVVNMNCSISDKITVTEDM